MRGIATFLAGAGMAMWAVGACQASPILGSFDIGGSSALVAALFINFDCNTGLPTAPSPCQSNTGNFHVTNGSGDFAGFVNQGGYVQFLNQGTTPLNEMINIPNWLVFSTAAGNPVMMPNVALDLQFLTLGIDPSAACTASPAIGQLCTPTGIPGLITGANPSGTSNFNLQNITSNGHTVTGFTANFTVAGVARNLTTGELSDFTGTFSATVAGQPFQTALKNILMGHPQDFPYVASFTMTAIPVPEPRYLAVLIGAALLAGARRIRRPV